MIPEALIKGCPCCIKWTVINNSMNITAVCLVSRHMYRSALFGSCEVNLQNIRRDSYFKYGIWFLTDFAVLYCV